MYIRGRSEESTRKVSGLYAERPESRTRRGLAELRFSQGFCGYSRPFIMGGVRGRSGAALAVDGFLFVAAFGLEFWLFWTYAEGPYLYSEGPIRTQQSEIFAYAKGLGRTRKVSNFRQKGPLWKAQAGIQGGNFWSVRGRSTVRDGPAYSNCCFLAIILSVCGVRGCVPSPILGLLSRLRANVYAEGPLCLVESA